MMTSALLTVALLVSAADAPKFTEAAQKELKKFEGKWKVTKEVTSDGEKEPMKDGAEVVITFKDRKVVLAGIEVMEILTLDPTTDPKIVDIKTLVQMGALAKDGTFEAIYKFDGDTLMMAAFIGEAKKRPANFDAPKEAGACVFTLKRVKE